MNLRGGWELIKKSYLGWMASRGFFWTLTFGWMVPSLLYLFVWVAVAGQGQVQGFITTTYGRNYGGDMVQVTLSSPYAAPGGPLRRPMPVAAAVHPVPSHVPHLAKGQEAI